MFNPGSLLLYKNRPARLVQAGDRLEIEVEGGGMVHVRPKDVTPLHSGPIKNLNELRPMEGEVQAAWEILSGEHTRLADLAELVYGSFTPASAWAAWQLVADGLYFEGSPADIRARSVEEVERKKKDREQAEASQRAWQVFLQRTRKGVYDPVDHGFLRDVENLAFGRGVRSQVLKELGRGETAENAHALLLELGVWDEQVNPYPSRLGVGLKQPDLPVPSLPDENRRDLTRLPAYAIDDAGTDTPDDALSFEPGEGGGGRLWVHVADAAALVEPDSPMDLEARSRGESLHLPEGTVHLLPREVTLQLGLGMKEINPALSFGIDLNEAGEVTGFEVTPSMVRVNRLTYEEAELRMDAEPFCSLERLTGRVRDRRSANGAVMLDFPEAKMSVDQGQVKIYPLPVLRSRATVEESMILAGAEVARFARENNLRLSFSQQDPPETNERPSTLSGMFALRRFLKRSRFKTVPGPHSGLGVPAYTQVTSPLRRYMDLVGHQQIRAFLSGKPLFDEDALLERIGATEAVTGEIRQAEMLSERHWTIVYLLQHPGLRTEGILVEKRGPTGVVIIPSLALEIRVHLNRDFPLDELLPLVLIGVNLTTREATFRVSEV